MHDIFEHFGACCSNIFYLNYLGECLGIIVKDDIYTILIFLRAYYLMSLLLTNPFISWACRSLHLPTKC